MSDQEPSLTVSVLQSGGLSFPLSVRRGITLNDLRVLALAASPSRNLLEDLLTEGDRGLNMTRLRIIHRGVALVDGQPLSLAEGDQLHMFVGPPGTDQEVRGSLNSRLVGQSEGAFSGDPTRPSLTQGPVSFTFTVPHQPGGPSIIQQQPNLVNIALELFRVLTDSQRRREGLLPAQSIPTIETSRPDSAGSSPPGSAASAQDDAAPLSFAKVVGETLATQFRSAVARFALANTNLVELDSAASTCEPLSSAQLSLLASLGRPQLSHRLNKLLTDREPFAASLLPEVLRTGYQSALQGLLLRDRAPASKSATE